VPCETATATGAVPCHHHSRWVLDNVRAMHVAAHLCLHTYVRQSSRALVYRCIRTCIPVHLLALGEKVARVILDTIPW